MAFAGFPLRQKRKEFDDVSEDFSNFSLSVPAMKIRRLDVDFPVIVSQSEVTPSMLIKDFDIIKDQAGASSAVQHSDANNEMALVLYKPPVVPDVSPGVSFTINPDLLASIISKNQSIWSDCTTRSVDGGEEASDVDETTANTCLAVVPWQSSQIPEVDGASGSKPSLDDQMEDAGEDADAMIMDIEDMGQVPIETTGMASTPAAAGTGPYGGWQQWQQQHCMYSDVPANASTPLTWSW